MIEREKAILADKNQGKKPDVLEKIISGGIKAFAKENCLLEQQYIHDTDQDGRAGRQGSRGQGRRTDQGRRLRPLRAR